MTLLPIAALLLLAAGAPAADPAPARFSTSIVVLRDGTRYTLTKPHEIRGTQARLSLVGGSLVAVRASEIDEEASKRATDAANAPPPPAPTPTVQSLTTAAAASAAAPKKATKTLVIEGNPDDARPVTGGGYAPPPSAPSKVIHTGPRGGKYYVTEGGNKAYVPRTTKAEPK